MAKPTDDSHVKRVHDMLIEDIRNAERESRMQFPRMEKLATELMNASYHKGTMDGIELERTNRKTNRSIFGGE